MKVKSVEFHILVSLMLLTVTVLGGLGQNEQSSEISWTISKSSVTCERTEDDKSGCLCQSQLVGTDNKPHNYITCTCGEETQTVHLRGSRRTIETEHVTWRIQNCPNVTIHSHILPRLDGVNFNLILANISTLQLLEGAFQSDSTSSSPLDKSVTFDSVNLATIPARSFPSNLARIQFNNSIIGTIQSGAFKQLYITSMVFENSRVDNMEPNAFYQDLSSWVASNSHFNRLQSACITGGIRQMNWTDSVIQHMESNSLTALIGHSVFARMTFNHVEPHGLTINQWSTLAFINNTFGWVNTSAIDLTQRSSDAQPALIDSNVWHDPEPNFITVGSSSTEDIVHVENNTFLDLCECGKTFSPLVTTEGSKQWFVKALLKASRCPISPRASFCLSLNTSASTFSYLNFDQLDLLCEHYACTKELGLEGQAFNPQTLPDRLRLIAIFLGILAGAIVLSLLITMCVYLIRRRRPSTKAKMSRNFGVTQEMSRNFTPHMSKGFGPQEMSRNFGAGMTNTLVAQEMSRNFGAEVSRNFGAEVSRNFGGEVSRNFGAEVSRNFGAEVSRNLDPKNFGSEMSRNFDPVSRNFDPMSRNLAPTLRPRSTLLEDVEMEDKGVQTMPSELSTDVLEGLREKLSKPDSFWDAKETIDHLYGLIQVQSAGGGNNNASNNNGNQLSSPPDVTMTNGTGKIGSMVKSASTIPIIPTCGNAYSISPLPAVPTQQAPAGRYAQIRSKPKTFFQTTTPTTTTMLCEYRDPSDSPVHIYSELDNPNLRTWQKNSRPVPPRITLPILSEYNEPKDVQMNVYAELTNCANNPEQQQDQQVPTMRTFSTLQRPLPDIPTSSSVPILKNSTPL